MEPTVAQMRALERALSRRRGLRQELDAIRDARDADEPPLDPDSDEWLKAESPVIIDIMRDGVRAVLEAADA